MGINVELVKALAAVEEGKIETQKRVYAELLKSDLLLPIEKAENPSGESTTAKPIPIQTRSGKIGLPVFTHSQAALLWRPEWKSYVALPSQQIFKMAIDNELAAIVLDTAGPTWLEIRRPEIETLLQGNIPMSIKETRTQSIDFFARGTALIQPHMRQFSTTPHKPLSDSARQDLQKGIDCLNVSIKADRQLWPAHWFLGKAYQALDNHEQACQRFEDAFGIKSDEADICNELALEYMELERAPEAIKVLNKVRELMPKDAGITANLGLAFLLDDQMVNAKRIIADALKLDAQDKITKNLLAIVKEIEGGKRPQPHKLSDIRG